MFRSIVLTALFLLLGSPLLLAPRSWAMAGLRAHAHATLWLMRWIVGTKMEVRGREHLPDGAYLVAALSAEATAKQDAAKQAKKEAEKESGQPSLQEE